VFHQSLYSRDSQSTVYHALTTPRTLTLINCPLLHCCLDQSTIVSQGRVRYKLHYFGVLLEKFSSIYPPPTPSEASYNMAGSFLSFYEPPKPRNDESAAIHSSTSSDCDSSNSIIGSDNGSKKSTSTNNKQSNQQPYTKKRTGHSCVLMAALLLQGLGILLLLILADWGYRHVVYEVPSLHKELFLWVCLAWLPMGALLCCLGSVMEVINAWR